MLKTLLQQSLKEKMGSDAKKMSLLPNDVVTSIKKRIREGAEDQEQSWANSLELVHKAYDIEGVVRPDPAMADAWKQYEEMLMYAVQQLAKNRGMDGDWRMSSAMFHESMIPTQKFRVNIGDNEYITEAKIIDDVVEALSKTGGYASMVKENNGEYKITYSKFNIRNKTTVTIQTIA